MSDPLSCNQMTGYIVKVLAKHLMQFRHDQYEVMCHGVKLSKQLCLICKSNGCTYVRAC